MAKKKSSQSKESKEKESTAQEAVAAETAPEPPFDPSLLMTGVVQLDGVFEDPGVLDRLRSGPIEMSGLYREAQHFAAQGLDIASLLCSREPVLVRNTAEILRIAGIWCPAAPCALAVEDEAARASVERYLLTAVGSGWTDAPSFAAGLAAVAAKSSDNAAIAAFCLRAANAIAVTESWTDAMSVQKALVPLFDALDVQTVQKMLFDPSDTVRVSAIKSLQSRAEIPASTVGLALILFRGGSERVCIALVRMLGHFATCPELVLPALLRVYGDASGDLESEITDAMRAYGEAAVQAVIGAVTAPEDDLLDTAKALIESSPQRYTDPLLRILRSIHTQEYVRNRVADILRDHPDTDRHEEIMKEVDRVANPPKYERPEWVAPATESRFLERACSNEDVYVRLLEPSEAASLKGSFDDETLGKLLSDASETVKRNAMRIMRAKGDVTPALVAGLTVWFKSASLDLATEAIDTYLAFEKDRAVALRTIVEAFPHIDSDDVRKHCFDVMMAEQAMIDAMFVLYHKAPVTCSVFIRKFLRSSPSDKTVKQFLACLDRDKTFNCVEATIAILLNVRFDFDNKKIRKVLIEHVTNPMSRGQRGLILRMDCIKLLRTYLTADKSPDKASVSGLQNIYKTIKNSELQKMARETLIALDQEIFDDEEEDDFEDLQGDD